jgi:hypothetical protein
LSSSSIYTKDFTLPENPIAVIWPISVFYLMILPNNLDHFDIIVSAVQEKAQNLLSINVQKGTAVIINTHA